MIRHTELGQRPFERTRSLKQLLDEKQIVFAGNNNLKIYGGLSCSSGKRMKVENRVFFKSEQEAIELGFRPCGNCMRKVYLDWKVTLDKLLHK
jgi:methylphosphotriester-DNA--protein-cysteine methyltransferase